MTYPVTQITGSVGAIIYFLDCLVLQSHCHYKCIVRHWMPSLFVGVKIDLSLRVILVSKGALYGKSKTTFCNLLIY